MKRRRFASKAEKAPGNRLLPDHFQTALPMLPPDWAQKSFVIFCPIGAQQLLRYCGVFLHDDFRIAILARFVSQRSACEEINFHFNFPREQRNIEMMTWDIISDVSTKAILKWTGKILFSDRLQGIVIVIGFFIDLSSRMCLFLKTYFLVNSVVLKYRLIGISEWKFPKLHAVCWCTIHSSHHFDISPLSREIKMKVYFPRMQNVYERTKQVWRYESRRIRTHHSTSGATVRRLGRILQRIFLPNQEAALVEPFGNDLVRVGSQGLFPPYL